ncbi:TPA: hypothetical protein ACS72N_000635 [Providencia alcalifaciens]
MIYQTGTITTTAGQTKIKGTGTRWKDNLAGISEGCPISYLINNVVYMNTVLSVNSDTEINLTYPVPVAASAAKYQIATFVLDSMSDGVRKMLANQQYIQYFLRNMDTWMTQDGIVEIKTPTGETVRLESIIALKKLIDGKFDKSGGAIKGRLDADSVITASQLTAKTLQDSTLQLNPTNGGPRIEHRINGGTWYIHTLPNATGTLMQIGDFGLFTDIGNIPSLTINKTQYADGFRGSVQMSKTESPYSAILDGTAIITRTNDYTARRGFEIAYKVHGTEMCIGFSTSPTVGAESWKYGKVYTTFNTVKDTQGNLRAASPIIKVFADHIELNEESEGVELEKLGTGRYKLKGTLGMNSDASWGGYNGGLVAPLGINGLELLWVDYKVLSDGDIIIETNYRKHSDLPPPVLLKRLITYPEFMDENGDELESYAPVDIPNGHWIDVRVNMPSDSIYNQKLAEAERLAKIEAERVAKEEAEKAAREEAERLDDESKQEQASKLEE